jgi:23S rRNA (guanosine2251-2'-O)-methyltransferase
MSELIYGTNLVLAALNSGIKINNLRINGNNKIISLAKEKNVPYQLVGKEVLNRITPNHQGVIAEVEGFKTYGINEIISKTNNLILALDGVEDPHNLGAILRTSDAAGINGIILPKNRSVKLNATVAKVSTGAIFSVKCVEVVNLVATLKDLKTKGYWIVGAEATENSRPYTEIQYNFPVVLVLGSEGKGLSRLVTETCDFLVRIPMQGTVNSLNVSVSAGILIYQIIKDQ